MPVATVDVDSLLAQAEQSSLVSDLSLDTLDLSNVRVEGQAPPLDLAGAIIGGGIRRTIEGASTLTITLFDPPPRNILNSGIFDLRREGRLDAIDVTIDTLAFRLVKVAKTGDSLALTFEEQAVALLRQHNRPLSVSRAQVTRAQFIQRLVREVKEVRIPFYSPELTEHQAIARPSDQTQRDAQRLPGFANGVTLKVKGVAADADQLRSMATVMQVADEVGAKGRARLAGALAPIGESEYRKSAKDFATGTHVGVFQSNQIPAANVELQARHFFEGGKGFGVGALKAARDNPDWAPGRIVAEVEGSGAGGAFYNGPAGKPTQFLDEAHAIVAAWGGGTASGGTSTRTAIKPYHFTRGLPGKRETSWEAGQRLASEVNWRFFVVGGVAFYISEDALFASRARATLTESSKGVDTIDLDWDEGKIVQQATVKCHANRWAVPPGSIIDLRDVGPASGYWLVHTIERADFYSTDTEITLTQPLLRKKEPAAGVLQVPRNVTGDAAKKVVAAFEAAKHIDKQNRAYLLGGGHGVNLADVAPKAPLDCSSAVSLVLYRAGLFDGPQAIATPQLVHWGEPGKGRQMTVWVNPLPGAAGHTWIEFDIPGLGYHRFDTSPWGDGPDGPHMRRKKRPTDGFQPRHYAGL